MNLSDYVQDVSRRFSIGNAREHTYRGTLQNMLEETIPNIQATNEPARIECGAPDYVLTRKSIPVGYIEAKDIGVDLNKVEKEEQLQRYLDSLENLILTDYLEFRFFRNKRKVETIRIAEIDGKNIRPYPENFDRLKNLLIDFSAFQGQTIKSARNLAEMMASKAKMMRDIFRKTLETEGESTLKDQMRAFKTVLMHDLDEAQFADIYAQTITYGLFTARLHDETPDTFSRGESLTLIPASNPFLRQLFTYVAGADLDFRVIWIVDALCEVYRATDLKEILKDFGSSTGQNDPILHFYETFLRAYDKNLREARGVWYTPEPVVQFIVRAIDNVLKDYFGLKNGIANTEKIEIDVDTQHFDKRTKSGLVKTKKTVHKVQLLDVATGTGTFIAEVIKQVYKRFKGQEGLWSRYVDQDLLPRLHGFELLMASYAMCHMKLDMLLQETGYKPVNPHKPPRVSVYLTNSLEEHHPDADTLFAWLSQEANAASRLKRDMPIMVAFGNPPYSGISSNMNSWIAKHKIEDYKYVNGKHFGERKHWLNDDYVQFIRLGEHYIEKNGEGILAYITSHSYLDNPTFRGMRWHLLNTFNDIYILDLHGHIHKTAPDGSQDVNVFDIQGGVSIIIAIKKKQKGRKKLASVYHAEIYGKREKKYVFLNKNDIKSVKWKKLDYREPFYFMIPQSYNFSDEYQMGFALNDFFSLNTTGIVTMGDDFAISKTKSEMMGKIKWLINNKINENEFRHRFSVGKNYPKFVLENQNKIEFSHEKIKKISYRPFDEKYTYFDNKVIWRWRIDVMRHMIDKNNIAIVAPRQCASDWRYAFISRNPIEFNLTGTAGRFGSGNLFPLYRYESNVGEEDRCVPNFDYAIYAKIKNSIEGVTPENLFDYIYAVLHSPAYRERYAEFLKSDFPRIPFPKDSEIFHALAKKGAELRTLHLMEDPDLDNFITTYPIDGSHEITDLAYKDGNIYINNNQYFGNVPKIAWDFYIGGYQPAQKWLKDRHGHMLTIDEIRYYQRIIVALATTYRIMQEIDLLPIW